MAHGTASIDPGSSPSVAVAVDAISGAHYQRTKLADATEGSTSPIGIDANPLRVRNRRRGTSDYDSGRVEVTNGSPASVTSSTIYPEAATVCNPTDSARKLTLTNTADQTLVVMTVAPQTTVPVPVAGGAWVGLKAGADGSGLLLHVAGAQ
jgi:hypothetical protein